MRIWSIHPKYLDSKGLVALWRETLLAKSVLMGETKGYRQHPQLDRFYISLNGIKYINLYLYFVFKEAQERGYKFDETKIDPPKDNGPKLKVTEAQIRYEFDHLLKKLQKRDPDRYELLKGTLSIAPNPIFEVTKGGVESWERVNKV